jgi:hypothetical protein
MVEAAVVFVVTLILSWGGGVSFWQCSFLVFDVFVFVVGFVLFCGWGIDDSQ